MIERIYYPDHAERYKDLPPRVRREYPDEIHIIDRCFIQKIKREKNLDEFTQEDLKRYGHRSLLAAKDIPLSRAIPKESK